MDGKIGKNQYNKGKIRTINAKTARLYEGKIPYLKTNFFFLKKTKGKK
jgi:hypothetical protein